MHRAARLVAALALLPVCWGAAKALWRVLQASSGSDLAWIPILAGAACWVVILLMLPKPMLVYVFGHELTHALWTWLFGGRVKRFKAAASGGHVLVTKSNFLISLSPYFFPVYAALVAAVFGLGHLIWDWRNYFAVLHLMLGFCYAFHITLTAHILKTHQSDLAREGYLFSSVVIVLGNLVVLLLGIPLATSRVGVFQAMKWWASSTLEILQRLVR